VKDFRPVFSGIGATGDSFGSPVRLPLGVQSQIKLVPLVEIDQVRHPRSEQDMAKTLASPRLYEPAPMAGPRQWHQKPRSIPLGRGLWSAEELLSEKKLLAGNPSEGDRAARLREISREQFHREILAVAPNRRRDVQVITLACRGTHWFGRASSETMSSQNSVRRADFGGLSRVAFEVRSAEIGRGPQNATDRTRNSHNRPSPWRWTDLHLPEPASGGNGWFLFRSCVV
jgi:hypothetical protein